MPVRVDWVQFLPIVQRELRVAARQPRTWWRRVITLLAALIVFILTWLTVGRARSLNGVGSSVFDSLGIFGLLYALLSGPLATADCLSRERREGTLGLLFLTDLHGYDVVFGKIAASSVDVFLGLTAALPLLAMPLLVGGITLSQFGQVVLALASAMVLSLAVGVLASSIVSSGRASVGLTISILLFLTIGMPFIGEEILKISSRSKLAEYVYSICPLWTMAQCMEPTMRASGGRKYWLGIAGMHVLAWTLLFIACWLTAKSWRDVPQSKVGRWVHRCVMWVRDRPAGATLERRRIYLQNNPIAWLEGRDRLQGRILTVLIAGSALFWAIQHLRLPDGWPGTNSVFFWPAWSHYLLCLWIAIQAPRRLADDKQSGALELLLCTSLAAKQILRGLMSVLWRRFGYAMAALVLLDAFLVYAYVSSHGTWRNGLGNHVGVLCFWATLVFPLQGYAFARVGLYQALLKGNSLKATFNILFTLGLLPWTLLVAWMITMESLRRYVRGFPSVNEVFFFTSWAGAHILVLAVVLGWASWQLGHNFRVLAQTSPIAWWRRGLALLLSRFQFGALRRRVPPG